MQHSELKNPPETAEEIITRLEETMQLQELRIHTLETRVEMYKQTLEVLREKDRRGYL